jgi:hypothetical protein
MGTYLCNGGTLVVSELSRQPALVAPHPHICMNTSLNPKLLTAVHPFMHALVVPVCWSGMRTEGTKPSSQHKAAFYGQAALSVSPLLHCYV